MPAFQPRALQGCSWATLGSYILQPHVSVKRLKRVRSHLARDAKPIQWRISSSWVRGGARSIVFGVGSVMTEPEISRRDLLALDSGCAMQHTR